MNLREVFDWIWMGVDLFVALWFAALSIRGPRPLVHGPFALLAGLIAVTHAASLGIMRAPDIASAAHAQDVFMASVLLATGAWVDLSTSLANERREMPRHAWIFAGVGSAIALTGIAHDPSFPVENGLPYAALSALGLALYGVAVVFSLLSVLRLMRAARTDVELRPVLFAIALPVVLSIWDVVARAAHLDFAHVSGAVRSFVVVVLARLLLRRLVAVERELSSKSHELEASLRRLEQAQAELDRTEHLAAVGELSAVIAHEIKNPLAVLHHAANTLQRSSSPEDAAHLLEVLDEEADRLNRLVDDVLVYARPLKPETQELDLTSVLTHATRLALDGQPTARNILIDWDPELPPRWVRCDGTLIRHAIINIVDNAILAMPSGGTIVVRMHEIEVRGQAAIAIEFTDEGEGMDTQVRERAKDPFFTTRETGTGLGLAIVDRVARVHGGLVSFASQAGAGTTVTFAIPTRARTSGVDLEKGFGRDSLPPPFPIEAKR